MKHILPTQTLHEVRQKYWICQGHSFIRKVIHECRICRKYNGKSYSYPPTPPLTELRLKNSNAFTTTGIDNFGPLYVRDTCDRENTTMYKVWATLYTCASSRAILIDLVPSLSSSAFVNSFRRFVSRRGCPENVISDNGTNFIAQETQNYVNNLGVTWHTNLPLAPWHGGFFERLVRSVKDLLKKVLKNNRLTYVELQTILSEIELILNNRPLTYVPVDTLETCITPNNLVFGRQLPLTSTNTTTPLSRSMILPTDTDNLNTILQHFWQRWRTEYLTQLHETHRNLSRRSNSPLINVDDVVLIHEELLPRSRWRVGRVKELIYGHDNLARGALVKTPHGPDLKRPVNKLIPVEYNASKKEDQEPDVTVKRREAAVIGELKRKFLC